MAPLPIRAGKGKDSANTQPCFEFSKGKFTKADKSPFVHRKLTSEEKVKRDERARGRKRPWQRVVETLLALLSRTLMLLVPPTSEAIARREPSVIFITSTAVSVRLCLLRQPLRRIRRRARLLLVL